MKFFVAVLGLTTIIMAVREAVSDDSGETTTPDLPAYNYVLNISLVTSNDVSNDIIDTSEWLNDNEVVYNQRVDNDNPIYIVGNVVNSDFKEIAAFPTTNILDPCIGHEAGTWEHVIVQTIVESLMPNGGCPVDPGKYNINAKQGVIVNATFRDIIDCGRYRLNLAVIDSNYSDIIQATYAFDTANLGDAYSCK